MMLAMMLHFLIVAHKTSCLGIQIPMTYDVGNDIAFLIVAQKASCHTLSNAFLKSMNTWQGFYLCCKHLSQRIRQLTICSVVNLPTSKAACSSAIISSACGWSLFKEVFNITSLGWLTRLMDMWAASWQNQQNGMCAQRRLKPAWASAQSDQSSLSAWRKLGFLATHWAHSKDSDQLVCYPLKVDEKAVIRNRYNRIPPNGKETHTF